MSDERLVLNFSENGSFTVITVSGTLDSQTASTMDSFAQARLDSGVTKLVLDLSGLKFISSAGLRSILGLLKKLRAVKGDLRVAAAPCAICDILQKSGFLRSLPMFPSVEDASKDKE